MSGLPGWEFLESLWLRRPPADWSDSGGWDPCAPTASYVWTWPAGVTQSRPQPQKGTTTCQLHVCLGDKDTAPPPHHLCPSFNPDPLLFYPAALVQYFPVSLTFIHSSVLGKLKRGNCKINIWSGSSVSCITHWSSHKAACTIDPSVS